MKELVRKYALYASMVLLSCAGIQADKSSMYEREWLVSTEPAILTVPNVGKQRIKLVRDSEALTQADVKKFNKYIEKINNLQAFENEMRKQNNADLLWVGNITWYKNLTPEYKAFIKNIIIPAHKKIKVSKDDFVAQTETYLKEIKQSFTNELKKFNENYKKHLAITTTDLHMTPKLLLNLINTGYRRVENSIEPIIKNNEEVVPFDVYTIPFQPYVLELDYLEKLVNQARTKLTQEQYTSLFKKVKRMQEGIYRRRIRWAHDLLSLAQAYMSDLSLYIHAKISAECRLKTNEAKQDALLNPSDINKMYTRFIYIMALADRAYAQSPYLKLDEFISVPKQEKQYLKQFGAYLGAVFLPVFDEKDTIQSAISGVERAASRLAYRAIDFGYTANRFYASLIRYIEKRSPYAISKKQYKDLLGAMSLPIKNTINAYFDLWKSWLELYTYRTKFARLKRTHFYGLKENLGTIYQYSNK